MDFANTIIEIIEKVLDEIRENGIKNYSLNSICRILESLINKNTY
jgi:hypothetical protein